jgi:hypothetical protein
VLFICDLKSGIIVDSNIDGFDEELTMMMDVSLLKTSRELKQAYVNNQSLTNFIGFLPLFPSTVNHTQILILNITHNGGLIA